jgi:uncharacterized membrane protein
VISSSLIQLGLVALVAGVVVTALVRAKKLGDNWDDWGVVGDLWRFGLVMVRVVLAIGTAG